MAKTLSVSGLVQRFHAFNAMLVSNGNMQPATADVHHWQLAKLPGDVLRLPAAKLTIEVLARCPTSRHFLLSVRRMYKWAKSAQVLKALPFELEALDIPPEGQRQRVLSEEEQSALLWEASDRYRRFWGIQRHTLARPCELRNLRWVDVLLDRRLIRLTSFKGKKKRRDGVRIRFLALDRWSWRLLTNMKRNRQPAPGDFVFPGRYGGQLTCQAVRIAFARTAKRAEIDQSGERAVCYTIRHTGATEATRNGVRDRMLADIMGHTSTETTARYQHLVADDLVAAIDKATARRRPTAGLPAP